MMQTKLGCLFLIPLFFLTVHSSYAQTGNCKIGMAEGSLDVNNVRARLVNTGGLFWNGSPHVYEVPKYGNAHAIFASSIWIAGLVDNDLRATAARYGRWEMWPGPLDDNGMPPQDCTPFDQIYEIYLRDVIQYEETGIANENLQNWPWQLGAPVIDGDGIPDN